VLVIPAPFTRRRTRRRRLLSATAASLVLMLAQCAPSCGPPDPGYALRHDFSLSPGIAPGQLTSCVKRASEVDGREHLCRRIMGHEESGDNANYHLDLGPCGGCTHVAHVIASKGSNTSAYGMSIVLDNGGMYEGCRWISPTDDYECDYWAGEHFVMRTGGHWDFVLRKAWNWAINQGEALGCASSIVSLWYGGSVTLPALISCADGPL
jgi:hypothetical protein